MSEHERLQGYSTELRRGSLILAVLACLRKPYYGYALLGELQNAGMDIEANTLYPLLRRLDEQGLLTSEWDTTENRPRKYYRISDEGRRVYRALYGEWKELGRQVESLCGEGATNHG